MNKNPHQTIICAVQRLLCNMTISVRFKEAELNAIRQYAISHNLSVSEVIRKATMEMIEDTLDVGILESAMERSSRNNSKTFTLEEAGRELGFQ